MPRIATKPPKADTNFSVWLTGVSGIPKIAYSVLLFIRNLDLSSTVLTIELTRRRVFCAGLVERIVSIHLLNAFRTAFGSFATTLSKTKEDHEGFCHYAPNVEGC
jgi:hypothetical protein